MGKILVIIAISVVCLLVTFGSGIIERLTNPVVSPTFEVITMVPKWGYVTVEMVSDTTGYANLKGCIIKIERIVQ